MHKLTSYISILLLLLFTRVMVPDTLFLELHSHSHTVHNATHTDAHEAQVGKLHKHCPVEDLFGASFQGTHTVLKLVPTLPTTAYANYYESNWHRSSITSIYLRGPPAA